MMGIAAARFEGNCSDAVFGEEAILTADSRKKLRFLEGFSTPLFSGSRCKRVFLNPSLFCTKKMMDLVKDNRVGSDFSGLGPVGPTRKIRLQILFYFFSV